MENVFITEQKSFWNKASSGWIKWNDFIMDWHKPIGNKIIKLAMINPADFILDIGTGAGEPGLSASSVCTKGKVIGIDISEEMVKEANETSKRNGVSNYEAILYDGFNIPIEDKYFDAAISRNGIMFSPDLNLAMSEIDRVLKPSGRVVVSGWGPPENNEAGNLTRNILLDLINLKPVAVGDPGPYRFAEKNSLNNFLSDSGLKEVKEIDLHGTIKFDSVLHFWKFMTESQMPVIEAIKKYGPEFEEKIKTAVFDSVVPYKNNESLEFRWHAVIGFGQKKK